MVWHDRPPGAASFCTVPLSCDDCPCRAGPCWRVSSNTRDETRGEQQRHRCRMHARARSSVRVAANMCGREQLQIALGAGAIRALATASRGSRIMAMRRSRPQPRSGSVPARMGRYRVVDPEIGSAYRAALPCAIGPAHGGSFRKVVERARNGRRLRSERVVNTLTCVVPRLHLGACGVGKSRISAGTRQIWRGMAGLVARRHRSR